MSEQQIRVMKELDVQNVLNERIDYLAEQIANSSKDNQLLSKVNDVIYEIARQEAIWIASLIKYKVPTADAYETKKQEINAVEVVRCQKCRYWKQHTAVDSEGNLVYLDSGNCGARGTNKDDYCSFAERKQ